MGVVAPGEKKIHETFRVFINYGKLIKEKE